MGKAFWGAAAILLAAHIVTIATAVIIGPPEGGELLQPWYITAGYLAAMSMLSGFCWSRMLHSRKLW